MTSRQADTTGARSLADRLVHSSLQQEPDVFYRAHVLVRLLLTLNALMALSIVINIFVVVSLQAKFIGIALCLSLLLGNFVLIYLLARHGNYRVCSMASLFLSFFIIVSGIVVSGGVVESPATQMLMVPPLMTYYFCGTRWGNVSVIAVIVVVLVFYVADMMGIPLSMKANEHAVELTRMSSSFICVAAVSAMAMFFERTAAKLKSQRDAEHRRATLLAETDMLTGLSNRRSFDAQLELRINAARDFVLFYVDLDGFKPINDQYGHGVGDEVLCAVAQRLRHVVRERDAVGRLGGDEFALLLDMGCDAVRLQQMAHRTLEALSVPMSTSVGSLTIGVSIGIACFPNHARDGDALKKVADHAMYEAKRGRHGWRMAHDLDATVVAQ